MAVFGELMSFWQRHMPVGMFLRSSAVDGCEIGESSGSLTLQAFSKATGFEVPNPLPVETFVEYGRWYQQAAVPDLDPRLIDRIDRQNSGFELQLVDGDSLTANRVVVAGGIDRFASIPPVFADLPPELVSHSSSHGPLGQFAGKKVAVIGGGQSALESAALLSEQGASVELIVRAAETRFLRGKRLRDAFGPLSFLVYPPEDVGPPGHQPPHCSAAYPPAPAPLDSDDNRPSSDQACGSRLAREPARRCAHHDGSRRRVRRTGFRRPGRAQAERRKRADRRPRDGRHGLQDRHREVSVSG